MKKNIFVVLLVIVFLFAGCASDVDDSSSDIDNGIDQSQPDTITEEDEYSGIDESEIENENDMNSEENIDDSRQEQNVEMMSVTVYYQDVDGYLIPVTRNVPKQEGIARAAVNGLIDSPLNREELEYYGLYPVLPQDTEVLGINIKEGVATIDLNNNLLSYNSEIDERNIVSALVYTLTGFSSIDGVKIWINGYADKELKFGTSLSGVLDRKNVWINTKRVRAVEGIRKADIYLLKTANDKYSYVLPVSIETSTVQDEELPVSIIQLLKEKQDGKLYSGIPQEANLRGSSIDGSLLTLNFDDGITAYGGGTARESGIIEQILLSMKQIKGIKRVKMLINGETANLPEGSDVSTPMPIPDKVNNVMDK